MKKYVQLVYSRKYELKKTYELNNTLFHMGRCPIKTAIKKLYILRNTFSHNKNLFCQVTFFLSENFKHFNHYKRLSKLTTIKIGYHYHKKWSSFSFQMYLRPRQSLVINFIPYAAWLSKKSSVELLIKIKMLFLKTVLQENF